MDITRVNIWLFQIGLNNEESDRLVRYARIAEVEPAVFIEQAIISHERSYAKCRGFDPELSLEDLDDGQC